MMNQQNPEVTLPSPQYYDRSLKTMDIRGAYPNKPWTKQEIFENRSLFTNDIRGAQPKISIRSLNQPQYDPSFRIEGFSNNNFGRTPDINTGTYQGQRAQSNRAQQPVSQSGGADGYFRPIQNNPDLRSSVPAPLSSQQFNQSQQSNYGYKPPYQGIQSHDPEKSSYYNGPVADRIRKPNNQPSSLIQKDLLLTSPTYHQKQSEQFRGIPPQNTIVPKSPQNQGSNIPQSYLNRPASNPNIPQQAQQQVSSPSYGFSQGGQQGSNNPNNTRGQSSGIQNNYRQLDQQQQKFQQSMRPQSNQNYYPKDDTVEDFKHTALIRPNHYDSSQKYQEFKHNIESRIVSPKHYDIPDKMQPKLKINREKLERSILAKSGLAKNQFSATASTPNLIKENFAYQPTPSQQLYQSQASDYGQIIKPQPLIQPQQPLNAQTQPDLLRKIPTAQSRPKTNQPNYENGYSQKLQSQISPKHNLIEKNIFQKPQSAGPQMEKLGYLKPYTIVPKVDNTTEYITKYNQSTIEQLQKSITPAPRAESTKVPWDNKQQDYNMLGNYVQEKRQYNKTDPYGRQVDKYFKNYDGGQILNMRKDIHETGDQIPYEVKFKYEKTKDNYYTVDSAPRVKEITSSYLNPKNKSFAAGKSDLFKVQTYNNYPINPKQIYLSAI